MNVLSELGFNKSIIDSSDFWLAYGTDMKSISYIGRVSNHHNLKYTTDCGTLVVNPQMLDKLCDSKICLSAQTIYLTKLLKFNSSSESSHTKISEMNLNLKKSIKNAEIEHEDSKEDLHFKIKQTIESFDNLESVDVICNYFKQDDLNCVMSYVVLKRMGYECKFCSEFDLEFVQNRSLLYFKDNQTNEIKAINAERIEIKAFNNDVESTEQKNIVKIRNVSKIKITGAVELNIENFKISDRILHEEDYLFLLDSQFTHKQQIKLTETIDLKKKLCICSNNVHLTFSKCLLKISEESPSYNLFCHCIIRD